MRRGATGAAGAVSIPVRIGPVCVLAEAAGHASRHETLGRDVHRYTFVLRRAGTIAGRVLDAQTGSPVAGVPVFAVLGEHRLESRIHASDPRTVSDEQGRYVLSRVCPGLATVYAFGAGRVSPGITEIDCTSGYDPFLVVVCEAESVELDLPVVAADSVSGRILGSEGAPLVGAAVKASQEAGGRGGCGSNSIPGSEDYPFVPDPPATTTDATGTYRIETLLPGVPYSVMGSAEGYEAASERAEGSPREPRSRDLRLEDLEPAWFLEVLVVDRATGKPIHEARAHGVRTDEAGRGRIGPLRGDLSSSVCADGFFRADLEVDEPESFVVQEPTQRVTVSLDRAASIAGHVLAPDGSPAAGAVVYLGAPESQEERWRLPSQRTDAEGRFVFDELDPQGRVTPLFVKWESEARRYEGTGEASPESVDARLQLVLLEDDSDLAPRTIAFRDAQDRSVPRAELRVHAATTGEDGEDGRWETEEVAVAGGRCHVRPRGVPFYVEILDAKSDLGDPLSLGALLLGPFQSTAELPETISLPAQGQIRGRVLADGGRPVPGLEVRAIVEHGGWGGLAAEPPRTQHAFAYTDAEGCFVHEGLGDFEYRIRACVPPSWHRPECPLVRPGQAPIDIQLRATCACTVRVVDADGQAVPDVKVWVSRANARSCPHEEALQSEIVVTTHHGVHRIEGLSAGSRYALRASRGFSDEDFCPTTIDDWTPADTTITLSRTSYIEGTVVDPEGRPIDGADIQIEEADDATACFITWGETDEEGRFSIGGVYPGRARLEVQCGPFMKPVRFEAKVPGDPVRIVCERGLSVDVRIANALPSRPRIGWRLAVREEKGWAHRTTYETEELAGPLRLDHLEPGHTYALLLRAPDADLVAYVPSLAAEAGAIAVTLARGKILQGQLVHPLRGSRFPEATACFSNGPFEWEVESDVHGEFEMGGLPPGPGLLNTSLWLDGARYSGTLDVEPGSRVTVPLATRR